MQIGCTKKLQDFLKREISVLEPPEDPFFSWSASLLTINRRKTIVMMHEATRCGFVLFGVTQKECKDLDALLLRGIRIMLQSERLAPAIIAQYLTDCQDHMVYTKSKNRSVVAHLNAFCSRIEFFRNDFLPGQLFQTHLLRHLNFELVKQEERYFSVHEIVQKQFREHYPDGPLLQEPAVILDVQLLDTPCFRRIQVPAHFTLAQLHQVLQAVYVWQEEHLHIFYAEDHVSLEQAFPRYASLAELDDWDQMDTSRIEEYLTLSEVFAVTPTLQYLYDFGDNWQHEITFVGTDDEPDSSLPCCTLALGIAPPEDCGGPAGYEELCQILKNPKDKAYQETKLWADSMGWQEVDLQAIQKRLRQVRTYL